MVHIWQSCILNFSCKLYQKMKESLELSSGSLYVPDQGSPVAPGCSSLEPQASVRLSNGIRDHGEMCLESDITEKSGSFIFVFRLKMTDLDYAPLF